MVTQMGFSDLLGDVDLNSNYNLLSSETKRKIEREVQRLVDEGRQRATKLLTEKRKELDVLANALVEYEVLNLDEMQRVLRGEKLEKIKALPAVPIKLPDLAIPPGLGGKVPGTSGAPPGGTDDPSRPTGGPGAKL